MGRPAGPLRHPPAHRSSSRTVTTAATGVAVVGAVVVAVVGGGVGRQRCGSRLRKGARLTGNTAGNWVRWAQLASLLEGGGGGYIMRKASLGRSSYTPQSRRSAIQGEEI